MFTGSSPGAPVRPYGTTNHATKPATNSATTAATKPATDLATTLENGENHQFSMEYVRGDRPETWVAWPVPYLPCGAATKRATNTSADQC